MSCIFTLASAAIVVGLSLATTTSLTLAEQLSDEFFDEEKAIPTLFADSEILLKTLQSYDCCVEKISENEYVVKTTCGNIRYARADASQAFNLYLDEIEDVNGLLENIKSFEVDYGRNVQAYTYDHIKENLSAGMTIDSEEVLDDDSLVLTIRVP